jgi:hypothetical protein
MVELLCSKSLNVNVARADDQHGSYIVPGLGARKQEILKAGGNMHIEIRERMDLVACWFRWWNCYAPKELQTSFLL